MIGLTGASSSVDGAIIGAAKATVVATATVFRDLRPNSIILPPERLIEMYRPLTVDPHGRLPTVRGMEPWPYTDALGRAWHVYDVRSVEGRRRAVPIGDWRSEARAFVPVNRVAPILVYSFGPVAYRDDLRAKFLEDQLRCLLVAHKAAEEIPEQSDVS